MKCEGLPFEQFMEYYNVVVPHIYTPEPAIMEVRFEFSLLRTLLSCLYRKWDVHKMNLIV